ncbi:DUF3883 domain-containing protein, partial [uncultured Duncaniella sp.]|uniref:protein NO VEIN domain-containing protein n=3 Tax=uncultured Duncaniella sp. TaxID=2768039 RepID=UPI00260B4E0D
IYFPAMSNYLSFDQCIALLPKDFTNISKTSDRKAIYSSSKGKLYFKGSKECDLKQKTWAYNIFPSVIRDEDISYIILAAGFSGIFVIPVGHFFSYRNRHPVGSRNSGEDFSILRRNGHMIRHESKCEDEDITKYFYPVKIKTVQKSPSRILFANIGWMVSYKGQSISDKISGGGSYSDADKHEAYNFQELNGKCYGYVQAKSDTINICRIDSSVYDAVQKIEDVLVVWFATNPVVGGSYIVGWYKHATVFRNYQSSRSTQRNCYGYYITASAADCTLLPVDDRVKQIPRQVKNYPGRSNIWYADSEDAEVKTFRKDIISYIESYKSVVKKHHKYLPTISSEARAKVEKSAVDAVWNLYEQRGYSIVDVQSENLGWDLEATKGRHKLYLEVKGQGNHDPFIRISRNEYEQMTKNKDKYRLCVVMDSLNEADVYVFLLKNDDKWVCEDDDSIELNINEQIAAIATFNN